MARNKKTTHFIKKYEFRSKQAFVNEVEEQKDDFQRAENGD